jgi:hypothetical protein
MMLSKMSVMFVGRSARGHITDAATTTPDDVAIAEPGAVAAS